MKNATLPKDLPSNDLSDIISGRAKDDWRASRFYLYHNGIGTQILIENYRLAPDTAGIYDIENAVSPLTLIFRNCVIKELEINCEISELIFDNCDIGRLMFAQGKIGKLSIRQERGKINKITAKKNTIEQFDFHCNIGELIFEFSEKHINGRLEGEVDLLETQGNKYISMTSIGLIRECRIISSTYPFMNAPINVQHLKVASCSVSPIELCGLFESIELASVSGPVHVDSVVCMKDFNIRGNKASTTLIRLSNTYIGGKFVISDAMPDLATVIDGDNNKFVYINQLTLKHSLMGLTLSSIGGEIPLHINHLSFENLPITKDVHWSIQGLYCQTVDFIHFRNAGTGNISNTVGGNFMPLESAYKELIGLGIQELVRTEWFLKNLKHKEGLRATKMLYLRSSDLGKINFVDTDFSDFSLSFYSAKLNEIFLAGSKMPKTVKAIDIKRVNIDLKHQERIAYSQLKKLHEQQGDLLASNEYFAGEMNAYYESMSWRGHFWEKLPLLLNRISSNHGQSWIRALVTTVLITGIFYASFLASLGIVPANPFRAGNLRHFIGVTSYFFDFINPLHKLDTFAALKTGDEYPVLARFLDGIARIFIAYFVYQLIQAFRKHGRFK
nr:hypothetical protein [uncultured Pedobacter sp.]